MFRIGAPESKHEVVLLENYYSFHGEKCRRIVIQYVTSIKCFILMDHFLCFEINEI